tara:strand:- start:980 stop:1621 length:642 start_codon:yes stop_codon:yes gene_type:complete
MGLLDKHKKTRGAWGQKIVRSSSTYGKNLDRVIDQNELLTDIETKFAAQTDLTSIETSVNSNTATVNTLSGLTKTLIFNGISAANINGVFKLIEPTTGKAIIPLHMIVTATAGSSAESANKALVLAYGNGANNGYAFTASKFMMGTVNNRIYTTQVHANVGAYSLFDSLVGPKDVALYLRPNSGSFNGNWVLNSGILIYAEVTYDNVAKTYSL